ncbi:hypothetical protein AUJ46_01515 [Candidatus Peregrinibacteria bacterium CG1_02_54_53]|nr:MAG: hypothetical protein AUJ46_01515 [Candidatus Peregrinibacteria bacterium CG1_02_54_53]
MRYVLVGNYGVGNFGDELLKEYFLSTYTDAQWSVLSAHPGPKEFPRLPAGIRSFLFTPWWRALKAIHLSDGVVFGGGSLFTDIESVRACLLWWWHAFVSHLFGKPVILAFQGIGPFRTRVGAWCARWVVIRAAFISVRDASSFQRIQSWKMNTKVIQTADPALSLFKAENRNSSSQKLLVIIPRKNSPISLTERAADLRQNGEWSEVRILSLQSTDQQEQKVCCAIAHALALPPSAIVPVDSADGLVAGVSGAGLVLAQRYHGALAALALDVPFDTVSQGKGDKLSTLPSASIASLRDLLSEGERQLRGVLFPPKASSGRI